MALGPLLIWLEILERILKKGRKFKKKVVDKPAIVETAVYILFVSLSSSYFFCP